MTLWYNWAAMANCPDWCRSIALVKSFGILRGYRQIRDCSQSTSGAAVVHRSSFALHVDLTLWVVCTMTAICDLLVEIPDNLFNPFFKLWVTCFGFTQKRQCL